MFSDIVTMIELEEEEEEEGENLTLATEVTGEELMIKQVGIKKKKSSFFPFFFGKRDRAKRKKSL